MRSKLFEKKKALELREQGYSLSEISTILKISKSSASLWLQNVVLVQDARKRIEKKRKEARRRASNTRKNKTESKRQLAKQYGYKVIEGVTLNADTSRLLCAIVYWCEGTKIRAGEVPSFTNSDPFLVRSFLLLLRKGFDIDENKLRLSLHIHDYHDAKVQLQFWSKITTIPLERCYRPYRKPHTGTRTREGYEGCVSIRYQDVDFGRRLEAIALAFLNNTGP